MTSKNLFSKLMREDIKSRLWALALISLGCFFLYPVMTAFRAGEIHTYEIYENGLHIYQKDMMVWLSFQNGFTSFVMMITAVVCGLSGFSYLNSRSKVDFYHSIPVRREKIFLANYLDGILIWAIPYGICLAAASVVAVMNGVSGSELFPAAITGYVLNMIYYMLVYSVVVIAAMLTGHIVIGFFGSLVFAFLAPIFFALFNAYFATFFETYYQPEHSLFEHFYRISPVMEYIYQYARYGEQESVWKATGGALVISLIFMGIGGFLYQKRPSEAAGKAMAFSISKPLVRIPIVVTSALGLGLFFWEMRSNIGWACFGLFFGALISHCVIEVIYHFDFRSLFSCKWQLVGCIAASAVVFLGFRYDISGYDHYLPEVSKVNYAAIHIDGLNGWTSYGDTKKMPDGSYVRAYQNTVDYIVSHMEYQDIENLLELAAAGIDAAEESRERSMNPQKREMAEMEIVSVSADGPTSTFLAGTLGSGTKADESGFESSFIICYTMNSGKKIYRRYFCSLEPMKEQLDKLMQNEQFLNGAFPLFQKSADAVAAVRFREQQEDIVLKNLTEEEKQELLDAYCKEFSSLTIAQMKQEYPVGLIRFSTETDEQAMEWQKKVQKERSWNHYSYYLGNDFTVMDYYPVYPSFAQTQELLKNHGVKIGKYIEDMQIKQMNIVCSSGEGREERLSVTIESPEEIEQLKKVMILERRGYYNNVFEEDHIYAELTQTGADGTVIEMVRFPRGKVPEFVLERLNEELLKKSSVMFDEIQETE